MGRKVGATLLALVTVSAALVGMATALPPYVPANGLGWVGPRPLDFCSVA